MPNAAHVLSVVVIAVIVPLVLFLFFKMTKHLTLFNYNLMTQQLDHFCEQNSNSMPPLNNNKDSRDTNTLRQLWNQLKVHDGILWRHYSQPDLVQPYLLLVIPLVLRDKILHELNEGHVSGHLGMLTNIFIGQDMHLMWLHGVNRVLCVHPASQPQPHAPLQSVP